MDTKQLNELLDFCEEQNLTEITNDEIKYMYNIYSDYKYEKFN